MNLYRGKKPKIILAKFEKYVKIATPWGGVLALLLGTENGLTHVFDPCWNCGRRLPAEEETSRYWRMARKQGLKNLLKTGSTQPSEK